MNWLKRFTATYSKRCEGNGNNSFSPNGGLALKRNKPGLPVADSPIKDICLPTQLVFPLLDYNKHVLIPMVSVGDKVDIGDWLAPGVLSSASGQVSAIENRAIIHPSHSSTLCVVVDTRGNTEATTSVINTSVSTVSLTAHQRIARANISGLGGAGFSTANKLAAAHQTRTNIDLLLINAVECEPMISCDEALIMSDATSIIDAIIQMITITACARCVLAIEDDKLEAIQLLQEAIQKTKRSTHNPDVHIELILLSPIYPSGAERVLVQRITGQLLSAGIRATEQGILCLNVATVLAASAAQEGTPLISRIVSVAGTAAARPTNVRVRLGTSVSHVLEQTGNGLHDNKVSNAVRVRAGGPLSGFDLRHPNVPITATTNCITVEPALHCDVMSDTASARSAVFADASETVSSNNSTGTVTGAATNASASACIRCSRCSDVCPVGLLPQQLHWYCDKTLSHDATRFGLNDCIECGCCDVVCPSLIQLTASFRHNKAAWREQQLSLQLAQISKLRFEEREQRLEQREHQAQSLRQQKTKQLQANAAEHDPIAAAMARARARREKK